MQNISEILKSVGVELTEDQTATVMKAVAENYKTIAEFDKKVQRLESERDGFKEQLDTATETLKGFDGIDKDAIETELANWKKKAEDAEKSFNDRIYERDFNDALRDAMEGYNFSSNAAKNSVMAEVKSKGLKLEGGKILGLNDVMASIKEKDADAFVDEDAPRAKFTARMNGTPSGKKYASREEIMKIKNSREGQDAIASNMDLFT
jgi:uncharacterized protein YhaN